MFSKLLKHTLVDQDINISELAQRINTSPQNLSQKIKRDNFSEKEMQQIAEALGLNLKILLEN